MMVVGNFDRIFFDAFILYNVWFVRRCTNVYALIHQRLTPNWVEVEKQTNSQINNVMTSTNLTQLQKFNSHGCKLNDSALIIKLINSFIILRKNP